MILKKEKVFINKGFVDKFGIKDYIKGGKEPNQVSFSQNSWLEIIHPQDKDHYLKTFQKADQTKKGNNIPSDIFRVKLKNNEIHYLYIQRIGIFDPENGKQLRRYGLIQDITKIRLAEKENNLLYQIVESTSDIIGQINLEFELIYINNAGKKFYDIKEQSAQNTTLPKSIITTLFPKKNLELAANTGLWTGENVLFNKKKDLINVSQVIIAHKNQDGQVDCFSTIIRDISNQKAIEQALTFKNNELDTFLYKTYHDLNGPVATLQGLHSLVGMEIKEKDALKYFKMYNQETTKLNLIVKALISLSKIKEKELISEPINFESLVETCLNKLKNTSGFNQINFKVEIASPIDYSGDKDLLKIIFLNTIKNSIQYRQPNSQAEIQIKLEKRPTKLNLEISDNGQGIQPKFISKAFDMFFRANEYSKGAGLGLYVVRNAVEKLKGSVSLDSIWKEGTILKISLPYSNE